MQTSRRKQKSGGRILPGRPYRGRHAVHGGGGREGGRLGPISVIFEARIFSSSAVRQIPSETGETISSAWLSSDSDIFYSNFRQVFDIACIEFPC